VSVGASRGEVAEGTRGSARIFWQRAFVLDGGSKERGERRRRANALARGVFTLLTRVIACTYGDVQPAALLNTRGHTGV
jgi:hypothetical protein